MSEKLDKNDIEELLDRLGKRLKEQDFVANLYITGGAAITLCYNAQYATKDVDAVVRGLEYNDWDIIKKEAVKVAESYSPKDVSRYWLNDAVRQFVTKCDDKNAKQILTDTPGLKAYVAPPEQILGMKLAARRTKDVPGIKYLCAETGMTTLDELMDVVKDYAVDRPGFRLERVKDFAQGIIDELREEKDAVES